MAGKNVTELMLSALEKIGLNLIAGNRSVEDEVTVLEIVIKLTERNTELEERITTIEAILNID